MDPYTRIIMNGAKMEMRGYRRFMGGSIESHIVKILHMWLIITLKRTLPLEGLQCQRLHLVILCQLKG